MTLGWGIAATGRIAREVGTVIARQPGMRVAAVASRDPARAAALARVLSAPSAYGSYAELVSDPAVQAVYVATPHAQHAPVVELALRAGRGVLCEKPLTARLAETERLAALSAATGTFLMEGMWTRFNPLVQELAARVRGGELGEVRSVHASFGFAAPYDPGGRLWDPALGGGALLDLGVYPVDFARLLLGSPADLRASGSTAPTGVDREATLALSWPGGARALLDVSLVTALPGSALVVGSEGQAVLGPQFHAPTRLEVQRAGEEPVVSTQPDRLAGFVGEVAEVAACLAAGLRESPVLPVAESVATMAVLERARAQVLGGGGPG